MMFILVLLASVGPATLAQTLTVNDSPGHFESYYVPAFQGTRLAVDVYYPAGDKNRKSPALLEFTRYWRSAENPETGEPIPSLRERDLLFLAHGYVLVKIDVRGTGASYGQRPGEYTPVEVQDAEHIVDWVVRQPWSDGTVGAYGTSYSGTTAELLCATGHEAVKAVVLGWSDFDIYESPGMPYGMIASGFVAEWSRVVGWLDNNSSDILKMSVRRVHDTFPHEAIAAHRLNPDVLASIKASKYKDSKTMGNYSHAECSPIHWQKEISASKVPMLVLASWLDAGTAEGALLRFANFSNPQKVVLMPTAHGGTSHASPYVVSSEAVDPVPTLAEQLQWQLDFFDHHLKGLETGVKEWPGIRYYNFGAEAFKRTDVWPPRGQKRVRYFLDGDHVLSRTSPVVSAGFDEYVVDFAATTGTHNRWTTQMGKPILHLDNRNAADSLLLTYTTGPLEEDLQITGTPYISLQLSASTEDGAVLVYLEDVDENGKSTYVTEGGLLLEHRKLSDNPLSDHIPYHTFAKADAAPMPVNGLEEIRFKLWPTSVLVRKGHSIRIAIAGADKDTFDRIPADDIPVFKIYRDKHHVSFLDLPIVD
ncbi:MAG: hypothetical protein RLY31_41 [Bacteroidota bacterium]